MHLVISEDAMATTPKNENWHRKLAIKKHTAKVDVRGQRKVDYRAQKSV